MCTIHAWVGDFITFVFWSETHMGLRGYCSSISVFEDLLLNQGIEYKWYQYHSSPPNKWLNKVKHLGKQMTGFTWSAAVIAIHELFITPAYGFLTLLSYHKYTNEVSTRIQSPQLGFSHHKEANKDNIRKDTLCTWMYPEHILPLGNHVQIIARRYA